MNDGKGFEIMIFIVLIMVIGILMFPFFEKIFFNSQDSTVTTNVSTLIDEVKNVYLNENKNINSFVYLPFKVEYKNGEYKTYCGFEEVNLESKIYIKGSKPISGIITWGQDNRITIENLKFKSHTCNKNAAGDVICTRNSKK